MAKFSEKKLRRHIRREYPSCPEFAVAFFVSEIMERDWTNISVARAVDLTIHRALRHTMTEYDALLLIGISRGEARQRVQPKIDTMIAVWKKAAV